MGERPSERELIVVLGEEHRGLSALYEAWQIAASARDRQLADKIEARYWAALDRYLDDLAAARERLSSRELDEVIADLVGRLEKAMAFETLAGKALDLFEALLGRLCAAYDLRLGRYDVARLHRERLEHVAWVFLRIGPPDAVAWVADDPERFARAVERAKAMVEAGAIPEGPVELGRGVVVSDPETFLAAELAQASGSELQALLARDRLARFLECIDGAVESGRASDREAPGR
jgi:hypothetical protein